MNKDIAMLAMQYTIELPQDVDAPAIEARVAKRQALFDGAEGLQHKSFLFDKNDHLYAPFYVWDDEAAAREFLLNDLFKGVMDSFHRPRVRLWQVTAAGYGDCAGAPSFARKETDRIPSERPLNKLLKAETAWHATMCEHPALYYCVTALDADRWEWVRYSVWKNEEAAPEPEMDCVQRYALLHSSDPMKKDVRHAA